MDTSLDDVLRPGDIFIFLNPNEEEPPSDFKGGGKISNDLPKKQTTVTSVLIHNDQELIEIETNSEIKDEAHSKVKGVTKLEEAETNSKPRAHVSEQEFPDIPELENFKPTPLETKPKSPTLKTAFFENKEIAQESEEAYSGQIEPNEYPYQKFEDISFDLASLDSQVPAWQLSSVEEVENAEVSPPDENLMEDNISNIKFLVETSTNLDSSQEPKATSLESTEASLLDPIKDPSPGPVLISTPESVTSDTLEPVQTTTPEPLKNLETVSIISPEPIKVPSPEPFKASTPEPVKAASPDSIEVSTPKLVKDAKLEPIKVRTPEPKTLTPEPSITHEPLEVTTSDPVQTHPTELVTSSNLETHKIPILEQTEGLTTIETVKSPTSNTLEEALVDELFDFPEKAATPELTINFTSESTKAASPEPQVDVIGSIEENNQEIEDISGTGAALSDALQGTKDSREE